MKDGIVKVYALDNCDTCRKALAYLKSTGRDHEVKALRQSPPNKAELKAMLKAYDGKVSKLFNTAGESYRKQNLAVKLPKLSEDQALELLSKDGMLVKRPFVLVGNTGVVGFKMDEWLDKGLRPLPKALGA
jgi:arsenate reductase